MISKIAMKTVFARCSGKLNLAFDILGSREDGYHEIETLFQSISLADELHFSLQTSDAFRIDISCHYVGEPGTFPLDSSNLIAKASQLFFDTTEWQPPVHLSVAATKTIPIAAGLAGGSANAAATLHALNYCCNQPLSEHQLTELAATLGADVPFCLTGGAQIGRARGDQLSPLVPDPSSSTATATGPSAPHSLYFLVLRPREISVATPWIYKAYDQYITRKGRPAPPDLRHSAQALRTGDLALAADSFGNVFQPVLFEFYPALADIRSRVIELGAYGCWITGSGPTMFALVAATEIAEEIRKELDLDSTLSRAPWVASKLNLDCWTVETVNSGVLLTPPN